ncbi:uncharacterized protein LOC125088544 [Lutra lutra]|uniref:uncharacterized protein LOC125088544 n=1 Tax=Lutra lutra TaxID=9657 RepID=UPI001FD5CF2D|nr:uncharacterized protein LOC125088544 [Lutra lutra]
MAWVPKPAPGAAPVQVGQRLLIKEHRGGLARQQHRHVGKAGLRGEREAAAERVHRRQESEEGVVGDAPACRSGSQEEHLQAGGGAQHQGAHWVHREVQHGSEAQSPRPFGAAPPEAQAAQAVRHHATVASQQRDGTSGHDAGAREVACALHLQGLERVEVHEEGPAGSMLDAIQQDGHRRREAQARGPSAGHHRKLLVPIAGLQRRRHHHVASTQQAARKR